MQAHALLPYDVCFSMMSLTENGMVPYPVRYAIGPLAVLVLLLLPTPRLGRVR
jgi:hypothetical protein